MVSYIKLPVLNSKEFKEYFNNISCGVEPQLTKDGDIKVNGLVIGRAGIWDKIKDENNKKRLRCIRAEMVVSPRPAWIKVKFYEQISEIEEEDKFIESYYIPIWLFDPKSVGNDLLDQIYYKMVEDEREKKNEGNKKNG